MNEDQVSCNHKNYYIENDLKFSFLDEQFSLKINEIISSPIKYQVRNRISDYIDSFEFSRIENHSFSWPGILELELNCRCKNCNLLFTNKEYYQIHYDIYITSQKKFYDYVDSLLLKYTKCLNYNKSLVFFEDTANEERIFDIKSLIEKFISDEEKKKLDLYEKAYLSAPREFGGGPLEDIISSIYGQIAISILASVIYDVCKFGLIKLKEKISQKRIESEAQKLLKEIINKSDEIKNTKERKYVKKHLKKIIQRKSLEIYSEIVGIEDVRK